MNDRYLFKAKRTDNGEWVQGCLVVDESRTNKFRYRIQPIESNALYACPVDQSTICQCTGMPDKNKKLVFEHDIVWDSDERQFYKIIWNQEDMCWNVEDVDGYKDAFEECYGDSIEVEGNIFDNPELLDK